MSENESASESVVISPIISAHLDMVVRKPFVHIPESFIGKTQMRAHDGASSKVEPSDMRPAVAEIAPVRLFVAYTEAYIKEGTLFQKSGVQRSIEKLAKVVKKFFEDLDDPNDETYSSYFPPDWVVPKDISGDGFLGKSDMGQKLHAVDAMLENMHLFISYAVLNAVFCDFYKEQNAYFNKTRPDDAPHDTWEKAKGAVKVLHFILNSNSAPDIGFVHGPIFQAYFANTCNYVNSGSAFAVFTQDEINAHIRFLAKNGMFTGGGKVCPVRADFLGAAMGVGRKGAQDSNGMLIASEQCLWEIYTRSQKEAATIHERLVAELKPLFDNIRYEKRYRFDRPTPNVLASKAVGDLSGGQS